MDYSFKSPNDSTGSKKFPDYAIESLRVIDEAYKMRPIEYEMFKRPILNQSMKVKDGNLHLCQLCGCVFTDYQIFQAHMQTHPDSSEKNAPCSYTVLQPSTSKNSNQLLNNTYETQSSQETRQSQPTDIVQNNHMPFKFSSPNSLLYSKESGFECEICKKTFSSEFNLRRHYRIHSGDKPYECSVCGKLFSQSPHLKKHLKLHPPGSTLEVKDLSTINCKNPQGQISNDLGKNSSSSHGSLECKICFKKLSNNFNLRRHMLIHSGNRPFVCNICGETFTQNAHLIKHSKIHDRDKSSTNSSQAPDDIRTTYECPVCKKVFNSKSQVKKHAKVHCNMEDFECYICFQKFPNELNLFRHIHTHFGIKPFVCSICGEMFGTSSQRAEHVKLRHPGAGSKTTERTLTNKESIVNSTFSTEKDMPQNSQKHHTMLAVPHNDNCHQDRQCGNWLNIKSTVTHLQLCNKLLYGNPY